MSHDVEETTWRQLDVKATKNCCYCTNHNFLLWCPNGPENNTNRFVYLFCVDNHEESFSNLLPIIRNRKLYFPLTRWLSRIFHEREWCRKRNDFGLLLSNRTSQHDDGLEWKHFHSIGFIVPSTNIFSSTFQLVLVSLNWCFKERIYHQKSVTKSAIDFDWLLCVR